MENSPIKETLEQMARIAKELINKRFSAWTMATDMQRKCYVIFSPNGTRFFADSLDSPIKSLELERAKEFYGLVIQYQQGSGDVKLAHLRNGQDKTHQ